MAGCDVMWLGFILFCMHSFSLGRAKGSDFSWDWWQCDIDIGDYIIAVDIVSLSTCNHGCADLV